MKKLSRYLNGTIDVKLSVVRIPELIENMDVGWVKDINSLKMGTSILMWYSNQLD